MTTRPALFPLGRLTARPTAFDLLSRTGTDPADLLARHAAGGWGVITPEDDRENAYSVRHGFRVITSYPLGDARIWVITESDRSLTTLLLPSEY